MQQQNMSVGLEFANGEGEIMDKDDEYGDNDSDGSSTTSSDSKSTTSNPNDGMGGDNNSSDDSSDGISDNESDDGYDEWPEEDGSVGGNQDDKPDTDKGAPNEHYNLNKGDDKVETPDDAGLRITNESTEPEQKLRIATRRDF